MDNPDIQRDRFLSEHILKLHGNTESSQLLKKSIHQGATQSHSQEIQQGDLLSERLLIHSKEEIHPVPLSLLQKYIAYARMYVQPK